ncbi:MAG: dihydroorotate dehydrogenase [Xanthobacteraceae bacterium]|nr:MAG: dihydroorotate dehydrogenase [Xanthobacteraceae bacterium]
MIDLTVRIGSLILENPVMPGSGTFAEGMERVIDVDRLGAIVAKTITPDIRHGNPQPRLTEVVGGMLSSIGIPSKGPDYFCAETVPFYARFKPPLIASISASSVEAFGKLAARLNTPGIAAIEVNLSCPNLEVNGRAFAMFPEATRDAIRHIKESTDRPVWAKLTPNVGDITEIAVAAHEGGADALVVANALLGMAIDVTTFRPKLGNVMGGVTGAAMKPVILRMVYQCAQAVPLPIIGCGGISSINDAVEYMLAGATAVQVGTANFIHPTTMIDIIDALPEFLRRHGLTRVTDLIGTMRANEAADPSWAAVG